MGTATIPVQHDAHIPWYRVRFTDTTETFVQASSCAAALSKAVSEQAKHGRTMVGEWAEILRKKFDQVHIANKSKEMIVNAKGSFVEAIQVSQ